MNSVPPKVHVRPEHQNATLFGKRVFADVTKVRMEMRSYWIKVGPISNESVLIRDKNAHTNTEKKVM